MPGKKIKQQLVNIRLEGNFQNEMLQLSRDDTFQLNDLNTEEFDIRSRISFVSPSNVVNNPIFQINGFEIQYAFENVFCGQFYSNSQFLSNYLRIINDAFNTLELKYDPNYLAQTGKVRLYSANQFSFQTSDYKLCKALGCTSGEFYQTDQLKSFYIYNDDGTKETVQKYVVQFPRKMYIGIARELNVICYDMTQFTFYEQKERRFVIIKSTYQVQPGNFTTIAANFDVSMTLNQLERGIKIQFVDENYVDLDLEGEPYSLELFVNPSAKMIVKQETQELEYEQYVQEQQTIKQQRMQEQQQKVQQEQAMVQEQQKLTRENEYRTAQLLQSGQIVDGITSLFNKPPPKPDPEQMGIMIATETSLRQMEVNSRIQTKALADLVVQQPKQEFLLQQLVQKPMTDPIQLQLFQDLLLKPIADPNQIELLNQLNRSGQVQVELLQAVADSSIRSEQISDGILKNQVNYHILSTNLIEQKQLLDSMRNKSQQDVLTAATFNSQTQLNHKHSNDIEKIQSRLQEQQTTLQTEFEKIPDRGDQQLLAYKNQIAQQFVNGSQFFQQAQEILKNKYDHYTDQIQHVNEMVSSELLNRGELSEQQKTDALNSLQVSISKQVLVLGKLRETAKQNEEYNKSQLQVARNWHDKMSQQNVDMAQEYDAFQNTYMASANQLMSQIGSEVDTIITAEDRSGTVDQTAGLRQSDLVVLGNVSGQAVQ